MHPKIDGTQFGYISVDGILYSYDIVIDLHGQVRKRKKKLSQVLSGTSHIVSLAEVEHIYSTGVKHLIVGTGQTGLLTLSEEAKDFLRDKNCRVELSPTPQAFGSWNRAEGSVIGMFHVTS